MTPYTNQDGADLLRQLGHALYGPRWQTAVSRDLRMSVRHVRRLAQGEAELTPRMIADLHEVALRREAELRQAIERLKAQATQ